ncbi:MAG: hypothetical protein D6718_00730 [Acidobacteria bacterium]|nr:MAG: hypothetical protein D6718_00730 [Acidobacteriota bacterium]
MAAHRAGRPREALALAEAAWKMTREIPGAPPRAAVVQSWYGYLLATVAGKRRDGMELCRDALRRVFWEPRCYELLARLEIESGFRRKALETIERGLQVAPDDPDLQAIRRWLGIRRPPPFPFLDRAHPLNRWVGRLLHRARPQPAT